MKHVVRRPPASDAYRADFYAWAKAQAASLRERRFDRFDTDNLAEEIEELARSDEREAINRLKLIVEHLLKLLLSSAPDPRQGWRESVTAQRDDLDVVFSRSPSLAARREALYAEAWPRGVKLARVGLRDEAEAVRQLVLWNALPAFTLREALDPDFFPGD